MADNTENEPQEVSLLDKLEGRIKLLNFLVITGLVLTICAIGGVTVWVSIISSHINEEFPMDTDHLEKGLSGIDKRLASLYERIDTQQTDMDQLQARIKKMEHSNINQQVAVIQQVLTHQQEDYGKFLKILNDGVMSLAQMIRGNREWTKKYTAQMQAAQKTSQERIDEIKNLTVSSPKVEDDK